MRYIKVAELCMYPHCHHFVQLGLYESRRAINRLAKWQIVA